MPLSEIEKAIYIHKDDKPFVLDKSTTGTDAITQFLEQTVDASEICLEDAKILDDKEKSISIRGKASLQGIDDVQTTVTFQESAGADIVNISLTAKMPEAWKFEIPGMPWFSVRDFTLFLQTEGTDGAVSGDFKMTICSGNTPIPISVKLPVDSNGWLVRSNFEKVDLFGGLDDLSRMVGLPSLSTTLPSGLEQVLESLTITDIEIFFSPKNKTVYYISLQVELKGKDQESSPHRWDIIADKIAVENIKLYLKVSRPADSANRSVRFIVGGTLLAGGRSIPISILNMAGGDEWSMQVINPDGIELPGISDFANWFGGTSQDFTRGLPSGLEILNDILLYSFDIGLNIKEKSVTALDLTIGRSTPWPLPNLDSVSLQELTIELHNAKLPSETKRETTGKISGRFGIAGVDVLVSADHPEGDGGWQFEGSTGVGQNIPIGELLDDLAGKFSANKPELPSALVDLTVSNLSVCFNTESKDFKFTCEASSGNLTSELTIDVKHEDGNYQIELGGTFDVKLNEKQSLNFSLQYKREQDKTEKKQTQVFVASYHHTGEMSLSIPALVAKLAPGNTGLEAVIERLQVDIDLKSVLFACYKESSTEKKEDTKTAEPLKLLFGLTLDIGASVDLSHLPLVGDELASVSMKDLQLLIASQPFEISDMNAINDLLPEGVTRLPAAAKSAESEKPESKGSGSTERELAESAEEKPAQDKKSPALAKGINLSASITWGDGEPTSLVLSPTGGEAPVEKKEAVPQAANELVPAETTASSVKWIKIQKSFGPVQLGRIGFQYQDQVIWFLLDASLAAAGLTLSLDGLGFGSPITKFEPQFDLHGLGISFKKNEVEIAGAFLKTRVEKDGKPYDEYLGKAVLKIKTFSLSAIGSYACLDGQPSMFIYAVMGYPLGGPPFFYVTGLAAGFGYNRALLMPSIDKVEEFPLVQTARSEKPSLPKVENLSTELVKIREYVPVRAGQYFLVAGVKFTSFKMIDSFAMLAVSFGEHLEVNVLGISTIKIPFTDGKENKPCLAEMDIAFKVSFLPEQGFLGAIAQLTSSSYILSKDCHLTGGMAFYSWFSGDHDGDFVLTVGGYHSAFKVPAHYPQVPRLAISWQVDSHLNIKGDAYFALTPSALMAGGHLEATWQSGHLRAWFNAGADFLIAWKPFHYDARLYVNMGISYTFWFFGTRHITVELGADLHVWGPEFTGVAHIHLWFISFSISFGSGASELPEPIKKWSEFEASFLPKDILSLSVKNGLVIESKSSEEESTDANLGIINPKDLALVVDSVIPIRTLAKADIKEKNNFGIAPMKILDLKTNLAVTITRGNIQCNDDFGFKLITKNVPAGLWGTEFQPNLESEPLVNDVVSGFEITPKCPPAPGATAAIDPSQLQQAPEEKEGLGLHWEKDLLLSKEQFRLGQDRAGYQGILDSLTKPNAGRQKMLADLGFQVETAKR